MNEFEWGKEVTDEEFVEIIDAWMKKQRPWNLQSAIDLLLRRDPDDSENAKRRISFSDENELKYETRAFTHLLKSANADPSSISLIFPSDPTATKEEGAIALDYSVYKKDFIKWADKEWDDNATHLTKALKRYSQKSIYGKKSKTILDTEPRRNANYEAMNDLRSALTSEKRSNMSFDEFHDSMMLRLKAKKKDIYARTKLRELFNDFRSH